MVDIVTIDEAMRSMYIAVPPVLGVVALVMHQFWGHSIKERWLGDKRFFWFYVSFFVLLIGSTAFQIAARAITSLLVIGGDLTWPSNAEKVIYSVHASMGLVSSILFAAAARYVHIVANEGGSIISAFTNVHLSVYVVAWACYVIELICAGLLCYGIHATFGNPLPFWFTLPFPVAFTGFLILCVYNRARIVPK